MTESAMIQKSAAQSDIQMCRFKGRWSRSLRYARYAYGAVSAVSHLVRIVKFLVEL